MSEYFDDDWMGELHWHWEDSGSWFDDFGNSWFDSDSTSSDYSGMYGGSGGGSNSNVETLPTMTITPDTGTTTEWDGFDDFGTSDIFFGNEDFGGIYGDIPEEPPEPPRWNEGLPDPEDYSPTQDDIKAFIDLTFADETINNPAEYIKGIADTYGVSLGDIIDSKRVEAEEAGLDPVQLARDTFADLYSDSDYFVEEDQATQLQLSSDRIAKANEEQANAGPDSFDFTEDSILQGLENQISDRFNEIIPSDMVIGEDGIRTYLDRDGSGFTGEFAGVHLKDGRYDPEKNNLLGEGLGGILQRIPVVNIADSLAETVYDELKDDRDWNELTPEGKNNFINNMLINNVAGSVVDSAIGLTIPGVDTISRFALDQTMGDVANAFLSGDSLDDVVSHTTDYWSSPDGLPALVLDVGLLAASEELGFPMQMIADQLSGALAGEDLAEVMSEFLLTGNYEPVGGILGTDVEEMNTLVPLDSIGGSPNVKFDSAKLDTLDGSSLASMMNQFQEADVMKYMLTDTLPEGESYTFTEDRGEDGTFAVDKLGNVYVNDVRIGEKELGEDYGTDWGFNTNGTVWSKGKDGTVFVNGGQWSMSGYLDDGSDLFWSVDPEGNFYVEGVLQTKEDLGDDYGETWWFDGNGDVVNVDPETGVEYKNGQEVASTTTTKDLDDSTKDLNDLTLLDLNTPVVDLYPAVNDNVTGGDLIVKDSPRTPVRSISDLTYEDLFKDSQGEYPSYVEGTSSQVCPRPDLPNCGL